KIKRRKPMPITRRDLIKGAAITGGALSLGVTPRIFANDQKIAKADKPLKILILGGTGFIGPHQVRYALARGHKLSLFNRGKRNPDLFPEVEHLPGDRNGDLKSLEGKQWDVVIDNPTTLPRWVRDAAAVLKNSVKQYIFISTISVYSDNSKPDMDETGPLIK